MTRRNFTPATKRAIRERSGGVCEVHLVPHCMYPGLPESCEAKARDVDHITPDWCKGPPTVQNGAHLCPGCHGIKTETDNWEAKKSARIRGEKGPKARRDRAKAEGRHRPIPSRKMQSRPFQT
jgi:hypothetical protein